MVQICPHLKNVDECGFKLSNDIYALPQIEEYEKIHSIATIGTVKCPYCKCRADYALCLLSGLSKTDEQKNYVRNNG